MLKHLFGTYLSFFIKDDTLMCNELLILYISKNYFFQVGNFIIGAVSNENMSVSKFQIQSNII